MRSLRFLIPLALVLLAPHPRVHAQELELVLAGAQLTQGLSPPMCEGESREISFYLYPGGELPERDNVVLTFSHGEWSKPVEVPASR